ncbi:helix-turn-helix domain-containing protein [Egicoccus sp. AB-alg6-2]|uniref:arsenate reductase/protein-tyrosine-phosphatase family protein n=1 Tax=Egicoccus sp. AB-alg6-2 TaxID=3242692 RepID=UPI00359E3ACD
MTDATTTDLAVRAAIHRALGDETRLRIVDALQLTDRAPKELGTIAGVSANLLAFHLNTLEQAGLVRRRPSQGDHRRRYVSLRYDRVAHLWPPPPLDTGAERVLFVCTANAARSQLAAALWQARTGREAHSAGTTPAARVHRGAVAVARRNGLDLSGATPRPLDAVPPGTDLVVSVCDRAHERRVPFDAPVLHWSIPDPAAGARADFQHAFDELRVRIDRLARAAAA